MDEFKVKTWNVWKRRVPEQIVESSASDVENYSSNLVAKRHCCQKFSMREKNIYLDINVKRAALRVAPSVVSLLSFTGEEELYQCSGTIIECYDDCTGIIITSANLIRPDTEYECDRNILADKLKIIIKLSNGRSSTGELCAYDFHYNLAVVSFKSDSPLEAASLRQLEDCLDLNSSQLIDSEEISFQLRPHSNVMKLSPGDDVVAVGRYFATPFDLMAAPGEYCLDPCVYDCNELFMTTCRMTRCGDGSPLINTSGEVIGVAFYDVTFTTFMPINVVHKWWEHYKNYREFRRPSLGIKATAFHSAPLYITEKVMQRFPSISKGVIVEKSKQVISSSSAKSAGLCLHDVIVQCDGKMVQCFLQLFEILWDNIGHPVELVVLRANHVTPLTLKVVIESTLENLNRWPNWK